MISYHIMQPGIKRGYFGMSPHQSEGCGFVDKELLLDVCDALRKEIARRNSSQLELAKAAGVSQALISNLLAGKRAVSPRSAAKLAAALGVPLRGMPAPPPKVSYAYCGSSDCPTVLFFAIGKVIFAVPRFLRRDMASKEPADHRDERCAVCEAFVYSECPNCCQTIKKKTVLCPHCHEPFVPVPLELEQLTARDRLQECLLRNQMSERICRRVGL
jgi:transcriptional regulator with XRE-family HTH domain